MTVDDKIVYLMRGLPSSGKSHTARKLAGEQGCVCETDDYFYTQLGDDPEKYSYDVEQLKNARDWSFVRFQQAVDAGITPIVVDRGNSLSEESLRYARYCMEQNYSVALKEPDSPWWSEIRVLLKYKQYTWPVLTIWSERLAQLSLSTHRVSASVIQQRMDRWQWDLSIDDILEYNPGQNKQACNTGAAETLSEIPEQSNFTHTNNDDVHLGCTMLKVAKSNDISDCLILNAEKEKEVNKPETVGQLQLNVMFDAAKTSWKDSGLLYTTALSKPNPVVLKANDLDGLALGELLNNTMTIDGFVAGYGWLVDSSPEDDKDFHKYSKANTSGLAYVSSEVDSSVNLFAALSDEKVSILGLNHGEIDLMDAMLNVGVQITSIDKVFEQGSSSNAINSTDNNRSPVSENRSFSQKLKEKFNDFGDFKFFNDKGDFNTHSIENDDKDKDDYFLMFSNTEHEKGDKGTRYEITEDDTAKKIESFVVTDKNEEEDGEAKIDSTLIDWSVRQNEQEKYICKVY